MDREQILIVDDEQPNLDLAVTILHSDFEVHTARCAADALGLINAHGEYPLVVSDMHMPGISGAEFLEQVRTQTPDTIRIMLTADTSQQIAVEAANRGHVFRFLNKPMSRAVLTRAVRDGLEEYRRRKAEKDLLAGTANGCIELLGEVLSVVSPLAFAKSRRVTRTVEELCHQLSVTDAWELTMAATLSQLGCITLPERLLSRVAKRESLSRHSSELWRSHPQLAHDLIRRIPRLERVAEIVQGQQSVYERSSDDLLEERRTVGWRAACLGAALEYDAWVELSNEPAQALSRLEQSQQAYPMDLLDGFACVMRVDTEQRSKLVMVKEFRSGMILLENLTDSEGRILLTNGQRISELHLTSLYGHGYGSSIRQPVRVLCPLRPGSRVDLQSSRQSPSAPA